MIEFLVILLLILLNGVLAMSEIAMVAARKPRLEKAAKNGDKTAKKALQLSNNPGKFLSTVKIGITVIGILMGIYSGEKIEDDLANILGQYELLKEKSETIATIIIVVVLTFCAMVLGELVPKRIGLAMPDKISRAMAFPMYALSIIVAPFTWLLTITTDLFVKILRIKKTTESRVTEEEIKAAVQEATESGTVQEIEQDIVENVFHLGDRKVNTLMTLREEITWLNAKESIEDIKKKIIGTVHKSLPVSDGVLDKVNGVIHSKDLLNAILKNQSLDLVKMAKPPIFFNENEKAYNALHTFRELNQQIGLVRDEKNLIVGVLTMTDIIDALTGDIIQELHETKQIIPRTDGTYLVDASVPLPEFARYFELDIVSDNSVDELVSVGELTSQYTRNNPHTGDHFEWKNLRIEIIDMDGKRVDKVLVTQLNQDRIDLKS